MQWVDLGAQGIFIVRTARMQKGSSLSRPVLSSLSQLTSAPCSAPNCLRGWRHIHTGKTPILGSRRFHEGHKPAKKESLFKRLFPDAEADAEAAREAPNRARGDSDTVQEHQRLRLGHGAKDDFLDQSDLRAWVEEQISKSQHAGQDVLPDKDQMPAMVVLSGVSRSLAESDFNRIGCQGKHLQGWNGAIQKVVQAYDRNTLEPIGTYFILFASRVAARSYLEEAHGLFEPYRVALHGSSKSLASRAGVVTPQTVASWADPPPLTLVPPSPAHLGLKVRALPPSTASRLNMFTFEGIMAATGNRVKESGRRAALPQQCVVLSLEGGAVDIPTMWTFIREDGERRNLPWYVASVKPYFAPKLTGPEGSRHGRGKEKDKRNGTGPAQKRGPTDEDASSETSLDSTPDSSVGEKEARPTKSARFVLSFGDVHEARRFMRSWHRRELALPLALQKRKSKQDVTVVVNVTMPW